MGVPLPDVESAIVLNVPELVTEGLPLSNADEPLEELVPPADEDTPPWELLEIYVDKATDVKVLCWKPFV